MKYNPKYPQKHLSIRVPWHDNKWNGTVCSNPKNNDACLILKTCAQKRNDEQEVELAGLSLDVIQDQAQYPACVVERATFMYPKSFSRVITHPYSKNKKGPYKAFDETTLEYPAYSAAAVPYNWMLPESAKEKAKLYDLDFNYDREPYYLFGENKKLSFTKEWIQAIQNQKALLDGFFQHIKKKESLSFFYAKEVPFVEASGRVLVGLGRILKISSAIEYAYNGETEFRAMAWEHMVHHSIRPDEKDGFLLPYHDALIYQQQHPNFDPAQLAVIVPPEYHFEFSYATEHVSHDSALYVLRECVKKIELAQKLGIGSHWQRKLKWLHDRIAEVEVLRGDYPGLGSALCALGFERGHFIAQDIFNRIEGNVCPWEYLNLVLRNPEQHISESLTRDILAQRELWTSIKGKPQRIAIYQLLSRFHLSIEQAKHLADEETRAQQYQAATDQELLDNPYLIYEISLHSTDPISLMTIDNGLMLNRGRDLLPDKTKIYTPLAKERIRALTVLELEKATAHGHTLLPERELIQRISKLAIEPSCELTSDHFHLATSIFSGKLVPHTTVDGAMAYQLNRLNKAALLINETVTKRMEGRRHDIDLEWDAYLSQEISFGEDQADRRAKQEKIKALKELANARFSVLIGPAGSGKTTLLKVLASLPPIQQGNVLMLAPTGKAKVRMAAGAGEIGATAKTIAQFLHRSKRFKGSTQTYHLNDAPKEDSYKTVIIDECSMLTEEMLAATIQHLKRVERLILVGDYRQLPPIGAGRPFVDIINFLKPTNLEQQDFRIGKSYVELTGSYRQQGEDRLDLAFANLFGGNFPQKDQDEIFTRGIHNQNDRIRFEKWENEHEFEELLLKIFQEQLNIHDAKSFNKSLGSADGRYFNKNEAAEQIENWQILSPIKSKIPGTTNLNRFIHKHFKDKVVEYAKSFASSIPKPAGTQEIVYGDKVINLVNKSKPVYPKTGLAYVANGEIGLIVGQWNSKKGKSGKWSKPYYIQVEFSSQLGHTYSFTGSDFKEEGDTILELAYALTIHKAQGSQFKTVILVIPDPCILLSRELIYTALTRQEDKVIVLYQGNPHNLYKLTNDYYSSTLQRITNLFYKPNLTERDQRFYERNLIHCASDGTMLRSKSEVIIYEALKNHGLQPIYEFTLEMGDTVKRPDFFIEDDDTGEKYYWEHLGLLADSNYWNNWLEKEDWYYENDIKLYHEGGGKNGSLIVTKDDMRGGISVQEIDKLIKEIFKTQPKTNTQSILEQILQSQKEMRSAISQVENKLILLSDDISGIKQNSTDTEEKLASIYQLLDQSTPPQHINDFRAAVLQDYNQTETLLENSLNFLVSAYYLKEKLTEAQAKDFSPYIIQYVRAIENELLHRLFLSFYTPLDALTPTEKNQLLDNEAKNSKTQIFATMLKKGRKDFTLGTMKTILSFIWKPNGKTLSGSPLLQLFKAHLLTIYNESFLTKKNIQQLDEITSFRNKAAHVEPIHQELMGAFEEGNKIFLNDLIGSQVNT